jgi:mRNA-degrading endonuclease RelE of RelBE toxin-antitoxin system
MFTFEFTDILKKKVEKLAKKDKVLAQNFRKKLEEIITRDEVSINSYKNLKKPMNDKKRVHLTDNFILLFQVNLKDKHIIFVDIIHRDFAYK